MFYLPLTEAQTSFPMLGILIGYTDIFIAQPKELFSSVLSQYLPR
jgi:hypothetical protein